MQRQIKGHDHESCAVHRLIVSHQIHIKIVHVNSKCTANVQQMCCVCVCVSESNTNNWALSSMFFYVYNWCRCTRGYHTVNSGICSLYGCEISVDDFTINQNAVTSRFRCPTFNITFISNYAWMLVVFGFVLTISKITQKKQILKFMHIKRCLTSHFN